MTRIPPEDIECGDFQFDPDDEKYFEYYILNGGPIRITIFNQAPVLAEIVDEEKKHLVIDNLFIIKYMQSTDAEEITESEFKESCLAIGVRPERPA
jgi:hypothetical protein